MSHIQRLARGLATVFAAASLTGCYTLNVRVDDFFGNPAPNAEVIKSFQVQLKVHHLIAGLVTLNNPEVKAAIDREVKGAGGTSARNVKLTHQEEFLDGLLGAITYSIYTPTTITITGDVVK